MLLLYFSSESRITGEKEKQKMEKKPREKKNCHHLRMWYKSSSFFLTFFVDVVRHRQQQSTLYDPRQNLLFFSSSRSFSLSLLLFQNDDRRRERKERKENIKTIHFCYQPEVVNNKNKKKDIVLLSQGYPVVRKRVSIWDESIMKKNAAAATAFFPTCPTLSWGRRMETFTIEK